MLFTKHSGTKSENNSLAKEKYRGYILRPQPYQRIYARLGRGQVFYDEILARQRIHIQRNFRSKKGVRSSRQPRRSTRVISGKLKRKKGPSGCLSRIRVKRARGLWRIKRMKVPASSFIRSFISYQNSMSFSRTYPHPPTPSLCRTR